MNTRKPFAMIREFHFADWFTLGNAVCGTGAIFSSMTYLQTQDRNRIYAACALVFAALIFDILDGRIARITLNRPEVLNAIDGAPSAGFAYDAVGIMMRVNGSAGMRSGAMWQRYARDLTVLMTHNTVQPELAADFYGRMHFGLLPHGVDPDDPRAGQVVGAGSP